MGLNSSNILLIDDDERFLEATNMIFNRHDFLIKGVTNGKAGIEVLKKQYFDYDMIFVDLDLPEMDGIEIFKAIRKINTKIPILFVSAHFGEYKWEQKLKTLGVKIMRIEKPFPIVTSKDFLDIKRTLIEERDRYREELFYPFKFSLAEFMDLAEEEIDRIFDAAHKVNSKFVENYFIENPDKDWFVIAKKPGNIIDSGKSKNEPFEEDLMQLAKKHDAPVFTYSRAKIIEDGDTRIRGFWERRKFFLN